MRSSSSRRCSLANGSMRVCVGRPGTFSTRKWRSARLAICGRCVIVITCARSARRASVSPTACAVRPPIPASISSKTIVSPPPTAAIASAMRESSPPDAVSATGANGKPALGRIWNATVSAPVTAGPAALAESSTRNSPSPIPTPSSSAATAAANGSAAAWRPSRMARASPSTRRSATSTAFAPAATGSAPSSRALPPTGAPLGPEKEPPPLGTERVLVRGPHPGRVPGEGAHLCEPRLGGLGPPLELFMPAPRRLQLAPGDSSRGAAPQLLLATERVEYVELVGGSCEPPLLELPGHRDHALGRGRHVVARRRSAPRVRTGATVAEHAAREYEPFLVLRPELGQRLEPILLEQAVRQVELRSEERRVGKEC